jgi:hypothetical protein
MGRREAAPGEAGGDLHYVHRDIYWRSLLSLSGLCLSLFALHAAGTIELDTPQLMPVISVVSFLCALVTPGDSAVTTDGVVVPRSLGARIAGRPAEFVSYSDITRCRISADEPGVLNIETTRDNAYSIYLGKGPGATSAMAYAMARVDVPGGRSRGVRKKDGIKRAL